jgi:excisionase family DNA binding protein
MSFSKHPLNGNNRLPAVAASASSAPPISGNQPTPPTGDPEPLLVDSAVAARLLNVSPRTLWQLAKSGRLPSKKIGRLVRFRPADLREFAAGTD